ncbi:hypothetical protein C8R46DRAFT_1215456 [Mycena filopes]|nr:hypothetical protein C8R46DRAFT_1215456 [Mycena filopes]
MEKNPCRDVVLYVPVLKDEPPALMSEEDELAAILRKVTLHFDKPYAWTNGEQVECAWARMADAEQVESYHFNHWYPEFHQVSRKEMCSGSRRDALVPNFRSPLSLVRELGPADQALGQPPADCLRRGERFTNVDWLIMASIWHHLPLPFIDASEDSEEEVDLADDEDDKSAVDAFMAHCCQNGSGAAIVAGDDTSSDSDVEGTVSGARAELSGQCEHCSLVLGKDADIPCRVFRCVDCDNLQCETCCHTIHIYHQSHNLLEWTVPSGEWKQVSFESSQLSAVYPTLCGVCDTVIAAAGSALPRRTVLCDECGHGPMCKACCLKEHEASPLHRLKTWNGRYWQGSTLQQQGLIFQMGHAGQICPKRGRISSLLVLSKRGYQRIHLRFCGCPESDGSVRSNEEQIRRNGWFNATLKHPGVCSTFRVY